MTFTKGTPRDSFYRGDFAGGLETPELEDFFHSAWRFFEDVIVAEHRDSDWDTIRVEIWSDSARILIFPAKKGLKKRIEKSGLQLILQPWSDLWDRLEEQDDSDAGFLKLLRKEEKQVTSRLFGASNALSRKRAVEVYSGSQTEPFLKREAGD